MQIPNHQLSCKLTTLEFQKRKTTVIASLKLHVLRREELQNGYAYEFSAEEIIVDMICDFIKTERVCCDFFTFQFTLEKDRTLLSITGPDGVKDFLATEVGL